MKTRKGERSPCLPLSAFHLQPRTFSHASTPSSSHHVNASDPRVDPRIQTSCTMVHRLRNTASQLHGMPEEPVHRPAASLHTGTIRPVQWVDRLVDGADIQILA